MYNFTLRLRTALAGLLLTGFAVFPGQAQTQMQARSYNNSFATTYNTTNPDLAVDASLETAATLTPLVVGGAALRVNFGATIQRNQQAMLYMQAASGAVDASVLGRMRVRTFLSTSSTPGQPVQDVPLTDQTIQVSLLQAGSSTNKVAFTATQPFDQLELSAGALVNVNSNVNVYAVFATVAPLPVQLTAFTGKATATGVALTWETATEQYNDHFVVERADSSPDNFQALSLVKGAGTSAQSHQYQFVDATPGELRYYRLRQVDVDGQESFSPVVAVKAELTALVAYPSIATETLTVLGSTSTRFGIFDQKGQQVQLADISAASSPLVDVRSLPVGVYFLRDVASGQSTRFVKSSGY